MGATTLPISSPYLITVSPTARSLSAVFWPVGRRLFRGDAKITVVFGYHRQHVGSGRKVFDHHNADIVVTGMNQKLRDRHGHLLMSYVLYKSWRPGKRPIAGLRHKPDRRCGPGFP